MKHCANEILFEDNHLLALNKPAGLLTQPGGTTQPSLEQWGKNWLKQKYKKPGRVFLEAVHRIDKPVSGIVLFAKTSKALSRCMGFIREKKWHKTYLALVEGKPPKKEGRCESFLLHGDHKAHHASQNNPKAKLASLHYRVLKYQEGLSLLEVDLETGRYHQIRAQLAHLGCPILGDHKYGAKKKWLKDTIALHHYRLILPHPTTHQPLELIASLPPYLTFRDK